MKLFGRKGLSKEVKYLVVIIIVLLILCLGFGYCLRFTGLEGMIPPDDDDDNINAINKLENFLKNPKIHIPKDLRYFTKRVIDGTRPFTARINKNIEIELVNRFIYNVKNKDIESARKLIEMHGADPQYFKDDNNLKSGDYNLKSGDYKHVDSKEKNNEEYIPQEFVKYKYYIPKDEEIYIPQQEFVKYKYYIPKDEKIYIPKYDLNILYNGDDNKNVYYEKNLIKEPQKTSVYI